MSEHKTTDTQKRRCLRWSNKLNRYCALFNGDGFTVRELSVAAVGVDGGDTHLDAYVVMNKGDVETLASRVAESIRRQSCIGFPSDGGTWHVVVKQPTECDKPVDSKLLHLILSFTDSFVAHLVTSLYPMRRQLTKRSVAMNMLMTCSAILTGGVAGYAIARLGKGNTAVGAAIGASVMSSVSTLIDARLPNVLV